MSFKPATKAEDDTGAAFPEAPTTNNLEALAVRIERQQIVLDARLDGAQSWRGQLRREVHGYGDPAEATRYAQAYDNLITTAAVPGWTLDSDALRQIHQLAVGGSDFRTRTLTVGGHHTFPHPSDVPSLTDSVLERIATSTEPTPVVAARLHLSLLTVHPFEDGNGRTARLAATSWLLRGGFRSRLLISVEEHFHPTPTRYIEVLDKYRYGEITEERCVAALLHAMIANAMYATWFRGRELRLRSRCADLGIPADATTHAMLLYDAQRSSSTEAAALADVTMEDTPLWLLNERITADARTELAFQVGVLLDEERRSRIAKT